MKNKFITTIFIFLVSLNSSFAQETYTENDKINASVLLTGDFKEDVKAYGLIFNDKNAQELNSDKTIKIDDQHIITFFKIDPEYYSNSSLITAFAKDDDGKLKFGNTANLGDNLKPKSFLEEVKKCEAPNVELNMQSQLSVMEKLIRIRSKLKENKKLQLNALLTPELLNRLEKTENSFGLKYNNSFTETTNPVQLVQRLYRVYHALRNYRLSKTR